MNPTFKIQVPSPCAQPWDEMTPEAGGRHCAACAQTVVDFTHMTDAQLLEALRKTTSDCGRFRANQLNRAIAIPPAERRFSLARFYKVAASLLLVFSAGKATAQTKRAAPVHLTESDTTKQKAKPLTAEDIEKMPIRDVASQVGTISGVLQTGRGAPLNLAGGRGENTIYIIDGVLQTGEKSSPAPKKWWQFWKRKPRQ